MRASPLTRALERARIRDWPWWRLDPVPRAYVGFIPLITAVLICITASHTVWQVSNLKTFALLLGCGAVCVGVTPRTAYLQGGITRDFLTAWVLPIAVLLPPVYAMIAPVPLVLLTQWRIHRGVFYRRIYTAATIALAYGAGSVAFHALPSSFAGPSIGIDGHALTWTLAVCMCEVVGMLGHQILLVAAVKICDPTARVTTIELNAEAMHADFAQMDLGVVTTIAVGINPVLAFFAVPTVLLARRFMMHAQLLAKSRMDSKTGLLNASTWESEAEAEIARAIRARTPISVALVDIDHFKVINDTYGHLAGDTVLRAVSDAIRDHLRGSDVAGRFGGEEFVVLLPHAGEAEALAIAERLRASIATMAIPIEDGEGTCVRLTVSVGVAALDGTARELTDLLAAADSALYFAKDTGRNKTHAMAAVGLR
jgi:diguanylate cyclase (GGDEF)-like protein